MSKEYRWSYPSPELHRSGSTTDAANDTRTFLMSSHRNWLQEMLEENTPKIPSLLGGKSSEVQQQPTFTVEFQLEWDIFGFLRYQEYSEQDLSTLISKVITLTGDGVNFQALPCGAYMKQTWPSTGIQFMHFIEGLVGDAGKEQSTTLADNTRLIATAHKHSVTLKATGTKFGLTTVAEQLFWMSTALQKPASDRKLTMNRAQPRARFVLDTGSVSGTNASGTGMQPVQQVGIAKCEVTYGFRSLGEDEESSHGNCWNDLFRYCVVVEGYPISPRLSQQPGLELPLDMMAALAGAERITPFAGNFILKGFSTLLFLTRVADEYMIWHLVHNDDGSRISFADKRVEPNTSQLRPQFVDYTRHIVGWAPTVTKKTGTLSANYDNIKWSGLREPSPGCVLEGCQIACGLYVTLKGSFCRGKREIPVHIPNEDGYIPRLRYIGTRFIVLHDVRVRKAWLVDGMSALLHIVRAHIAYESSEDQKKIYGEIMISRPEDLKLRKDGCTGQEAAFETLKDPRNLQLQMHWKPESVFHRKLDPKDNNPESRAAEYYYLFDAIKYILHLLEQAIDHQAGMRADSNAGYPIKLSLHAQLEGFDFMDFAEKSHLIRPKTIRLLEDGKAWVGLTRAVHAVTLFGKGFGELIEPVRGANGEQNGCVECFPTHRDVLAVAVSDLQRMDKQLEDSNSTDWRLVDDIHLDLSPELFMKCSLNSERVCQSQRVQRLQRKSAPERERRHTTNEPIEQVEFLDGAVLLGKTPSIIQSLLGKYRNRR